MTADIILGVVQRKVIAASPHKCQDYRELDDNGVQRAVESFAFDYLHLSQLELVDCVFDAFVAAWKEEGRYTADYEEVGEWVFQLQDFGENLKKEADQYKGVLGCKA